MTRIVERFFPADGRALIVAMDHGLAGNHPGFEDPGATLAKVLAGGPDGIMITPGFARCFAEELGKASGVRIVTRMDYITFSTSAEFLGDIEMQVPIASVAESVRLGARAICCYLIFGREDHRVMERNIAYLARYAEEAHVSGLPLIAEVVFWGKKNFSGAIARVDMLENAYRIAFEIGADILKVPYLEDRAAFARMMRNLPIPVLILGGGKMETEKDTFRVAKEACEDGARGILFGRNIWQHENPSGMITALHGIVHGKSSIAQALACLSGKGT